jgi:hypothetical protein
MQSYLICHGLACKHGCEHGLEFWSSQNVEQMSPQVITKGATIFSG